MNHRLISRVITNLVVVLINCGASATAAVLPTNGSAGDVQTKINAAQDGDTITIPAGTFTWSSGVSINGKGVHLRGAGSGRVIGRSNNTLAVGTGGRTFSTQSGLPISIGQTLRVERTGGVVVNAMPTNERAWMEGTVTAYQGTGLIMNMTASEGSGSHPLWIISTMAQTTIVHSAGGVLFDLDEDATHHVELSGLRLTTGSGGDDYITIGGGSGKAILIHDMYFESSQNFDCIQTNANRGVIWNCSFSAIPYSRAQLAIHHVHASNNSWTTPSTMGMADTTGTNNLYIEDSDFHAWTNATDFDNNARAVMRHCTFNNAGMGTHGADTSEWGYRHFEFYDSSIWFDGFTNNQTFPYSRLFYLRGGTGVIADNVINIAGGSDYPNKIAIDMTVMNLQRSGGPNPCWGAGQAGNQYPAPRQVGMGRVTGTAGNDSITYRGDSEPLYIWGNTGNYRPGTSDFGPEGGCTNPDSSQDYIVQGRDYFWTPDDPTNPNAGAKPGYTKYTYPHPLRSASVPLPPNPTIHYVRLGANGDGSSWANAYPNLPSTLQRGHTYFIADSEGQSYGQHIFDDADAPSGPQMITIKKAINDSRCLQLGKTTAECHGPASDWNQSYGDGQAIFGNLVMVTDNYTIDGQIRNENNWQDVASYGFRLTERLEAHPINYGRGSSHVNLRYIDVGGAVSDTFDPSGPDEGFYIAGFGQILRDWTISRCHVHNVIVPVRYLDVAGAVLEYTWMGPNWGKETIRGSGRSSELVIRHNVLKDGCQGTPGDPTAPGCTAQIGIWDGDTPGDYDNNKIYGNLIWTTKSTAHSDACVFVGGVPGVSGNNNEFYNNTLVGIQQGQCHLSVPGGSNNSIRNNLWYGLGANVGTGCVGTTCSNNVKVTSPNPFVNSASGDFRLSGPTAAGATLASPYNFDRFGSTRGVDGTWDIGAYEYSGPVTPPPPPGRTFYVDFTAGNDANNGTSPSTPWKRAPGMAGYAGSFTLQAGDKVLFDREDTWDVSGGVQGFWLVGGVTYIGNQWPPGINRAHIRAASNFDAGVVRFRDHPTVETVFEGFDVDANNMATNGVDINAGRWTLLNGATKRLKDCGVHDVGGTWQQGQYTYGIIVSNHGGIGGYTENVEIIGNYVYNIARDGLCLYPGDENADCRIKNILVRGNAVTAVGRDSTYGAGSGIIVKGFVVDAVIEYNTVSGAIPANLIFVNGNESNHFAQDSNGQPVGPTNIHIRYNILNGAQAGQGCILVYENGSGKDPMDLKIYGNLAFNNSNLGGLWFDSGLGNTKKIRVYNNTFYNAPVTVNNSAATFQPFEFVNNIVYRVSGTPITGSARFTLSSNNLTANPFFVNVNNPPTLFTSFDGGVHLEPNTNGFSVPNNSAASNAGTFLPAPYNSSINSVTRQASAFDIGAYETPVSTLPPDTTPPVISNVNASGISNSGATITWTTDEQSDSQVEYGATTAYGNSSTVNTTRVTSHAVTLTNLAPGTLYHFRVKSRDASNNLGTSGDFTFTTTAAAPPPTITTQPQSRTVGVGQTATFTVQATGTGLSYQWRKNNNNIGGATSASYTTPAALLSDHNASFDCVVSNAGGSVTSNAAILTIDSTAPTFSNIAATAISNNSATINWTTNELSDTQIEYGLTTSYGNSTVLNTTRSLNHSGGLSGLTPSTLYHYRVKSRDAFNNLATSGDFMFTTTAVPDTTAPTITNITASPTYNAADISWTTNEAADSQVEYGLTTSYGTQTTVNASRVTDHDMTITGLQSNRTYHYRVRSRDAANNVSTSPDRTFVTSAAPDTTPPTISDVRAVSTNNEAVINWTTNEPANSQVEWWVIPSIRYTTTLEPTMSTNHSATLTGLTAGLLYYYRVISADASGNESSSADQYFTASPGGSTGGGGEIETNISETNFLPFKNVFNPVKGEVAVLKYSVAGTNTTSAGAHASALYGGGGSSEVSLIIYDRTGEEVRVLARSATEGMLHDTPWDGRNEKGEIVASGVYIAILRHGNRVVRRKLVVIK